MSFFGRFKCKVNGHWKSVGSDMYQSLKETYRLDDELHLKYCTRCHKVSLCVRETRERLWNPALGRTRTTRSLSTRTMRCGYVSGR